MRSDGSSAFVWRYATLACCVILQLHRATEGVVYPIPIPDVEKNSRHWMYLGRDAIKRRLENRLNTNVAKNVVLFLGDGMGMSTVTACRIYKGQMHNQSGEEAELVFENFPYTSFSKTYALDMMTPDSANTATAYLCGVKGNYATVGVNGKVNKNDCQASLDPSTHTESIMAWAQAAGKWTGIVTTTRVTHATPSGAYAHSAQRDWEAYVPEGCRAKDIALQLIEDSPGRDFRVILGGGRRSFLNATIKGNASESGQRKDGRNLISDWTRTKSGKTKYVTDREGLLNADVNRIDYLLGLFNNNHLEYAVHRKETEPTLKEMTKVAIRMLQRNPKGFVLLVEGGKIDLGHHANRAAYALREAYELDLAIEAALKLIDERDTLTVVTADHSHTFTIGGYPERGTSILGTAGLSDKDNYTLPILSYANGPTYNTTRINFTEEVTGDVEFQYPVLYPLEDETHGGEDVPVYARGPMAHLFTGVHDQTYIAHAMAYAACIGSNKEHCSNYVQLSCSVCPHTGSALWCTVLLCIVALKQVL